VSTPSPRFWARVAGAVPSARRRGGTHPVVVGTPRPDRAPVPRKVNRKWHGDGTQIATEEGMESELHAAPSASPLKLRPEPRPRAGSPVDLSEGSGVTCTLQASLEIDPLGSGCGERAVPDVRRWLFP